MVHIDHFSTFWIQMPVFPDPVKDNHGVIDRIPDNRQDGTDKNLVDFERER